MFVIFVNGESMLKLYTRISLMDTGVLGQSQLLNNLSVNINDFLEESSMTRMPPLYPGSRKKFDPNTENKNWY